MPRINTATRKRLARSRRLRQGEIGFRTPVRNNSAFRFDASLRIAGVGAHHNDIAIKTGLLPSHLHKAGDRRSIKSASLGVWPEDLWTLESPLGELASLEEHLNWLWSTIAPHKAYFERLIVEATWADVSLGCLSESVYPFWIVPASSLDITRELKLGLSFNFTLT
jgi:Domain of unknown function (DUF4279)